MFIIDYLQLCFCCRLYGYSPIRRIVYQNCGDSYDVCENCRSFHGTCPDHPNNKEASPYPYQQLQSGGGVSGSDQCDSCKIVYLDNSVKLVVYCICGESFNLCLDCHTAQRKCPNHPVTVVSHVYVQKSQDGWRWEVVAGGEGYKKLNHW